jgi:hypothetical protein
VEEPCELLSELLLVSGLLLKYYRDWRRVGVIGAEAMIGSRP